MFSLPLKIFAALAYGIAAIVLAFVAFSSVIGLLLMTGILVTVFLTWRWLRRH